VEIDLVVRRGDLVVFVEVKTRRSRSQGAPEEAVDARKRARLVRGAAAWLREQAYRPRRTRFDVVTCEPTASGWCLRQIEAAFEAGE
jgi:putative endonuclease